jgi:hypothetical protein
MTSRLPALLLVAAILLSFSLTSAATVKMMGAGNVTCKEWLQLRTSTEYFSAGNWLLGFLSSTSWNTGEDILASKKADVLFKAVDEFCADMPDKTIADAAVELSLHMLDKASRE